MQGYDADENYFSDEGLDTNTETLMEKLENASDFDAYRERSQSRDASSEEASEGPSEQLPPSSSTRTAPSREAGSYALLLALLASAGAIAGAFLSSYMRG